MKTTLFLLLMIIFFPLNPVFAQNRSVSGNVISALRNAGIQAVSEGMEPFDFTLPLLNGTTFTLSELKGKVVFLNFWATWCPPCRDEMPSMEALYQRFKNREFEMIAVNLGERTNIVSSFMNQNNLSFPAVLDLRQVTGNMYGIRSIPTTFIIDKRGLIVGRVIGAIDWNTPRVVAAFEALLAEN